jgi:hypothetical protein
VRRILLESADASVDQVTGRVSRVIELKSIELKSIELKSIELKSIKLKTIDLSTERLEGVLRMI